MADRNRDSRSDRFFRLLLRAFPVNFRGDYGRDMEQVFRTGRREVEEEGLMAQLTFWGETIRGIVRTAPGEHLSMLRQDAAYAIRMMSRNLGFTTVVVATLAVGIGANTAIFSVVNAVLLRSLPFADADRLVVIYEELPKFETGRMGFSATDVEPFTKHAASFDGVAAFQNKEYELSGVDQPERSVGARVSAALFPVLGIPPALGRAFTREEDTEARPVVVLSDGVWRRTFGGDPGILGRGVTLDRTRYTVIGVMPAGFEFPLRGPIFNNRPAAFFLPISFTEYERQAYGEMFNNTLVVRLKRGVSLAQARAESATLVRRMEALYPSGLRSDPRFALGVDVEPLQADVVGRSERLLLVLMVAVGMVLLIGCADIANLMLTNAAGRRREMTIRTALGANRARLVRQLLTESGLLALAGGGLGLLLARWAVTLLVSLAPDTMPRADAIDLDPRVMAFTLLLCVATAFLFGLLPAVEASRQHTAEALKEDSRGSTPGQRRHRVLGFLVVSQVALALLLATAAGLLLRSFDRLRSTDPGFQPDHLMSLTTTLPASGYEKAVQIRGFYQELVRRSAALPSVTSVAAATDLPLQVRERRTFSLDSPAAAPQHPPTVAHTWVLGQYFEALRVPLRKGRYFTPGDGLNGQRAIIVNEMAARRFWPAQDPVGRRIKWGTAESTAPWMTVVGVVGDVKHGPMQEDTMPQTYEPYLQVSDAGIEENVTGFLRTLTLIVRARSEPTSLIAALRGTVRGLDSSLPVTNVVTLDKVISTSVAPQRFSTSLLTGFAAVALLLASIGIYGVLASSVAQRTHEIGLRMALGAEPRGVRWMIMGQGMKLVAIGLVFGLAGSLALTRMLSSLLYQVPPDDPVTFASVGGLLTAVALLATYLPARRAMRVDPMVALRAE